MRLVVQGLMVEGELTRNHNGIECGGKDAATFCASAPRARGWRGGRHACHSGGRYAEWLSRHVGARGHAGDLEMSKGRRQGCLR